MAIMFLLKMEEIEELYGNSRYTEFLKQYAEHPEWFDFDDDYFAEQLPGRKKSLAWNGKEGIDIYTNMINKEYKN